VVFFYLREERGFGEPINQLSKSGDNSNFLQKRVPVSQSINQV
jgi:hypothetical protein